MHRLEHSSGCLTAWSRSELIVDGATHFVLGPPGRSIEAPLRSRSAKAGRNHRRGVAPYIEVPEKAGISVNSAPPELGKLPTFQTLSEEPVLRQLAEDGDPSAWLNAALACWCRSRLAGMSPNGRQPTCKNAAKETHRYSSISPSRSKIGRKPAYESVNLVRFHRDVVLA